MPACKEISKRGLDAGKTRKFGLQDLLYRSIREEFGLTARAVIRCIGKVADSNTTQTANKREGLVRFRKLAAQPFDHRIFRCGQQDEHLDAPRSPDDSVRLR
jgi:hypothetical protein